MIKPGVDADGIAQTESDHFMKCPGCGEWFDMRDLGEVIEHMHELRSISRRLGKADHRNY